MIGILKRLVQGKSLLRTDEIPFSAIEMWFDKKLKETVLSEEVADVLNEMNDSFKIIHNALKRLSQRKADVEMDADEFASVEAGRKEYIGELFDFVKLMESHEKTTPQTIINFNSAFAEALGQIEIGLNHQFSIVSKFFFEEADEIKEALDELKESQKKLEELINDETGLVYVLSVTSKIKEIKKKQKDIIALKQQLEVESAKLQQVEDYKLKLETEVDDLKTSSEFEKYDSLVSTKLRKEKEIEREDDRIQTQFSVLKKALIAYDKNNLGPDGMLARKYADDPLAALKYDSKFWIAGLLKTVSDRITEIEPNESKAVKIKNIISNLSEENLKSYVSKCNSLRDAVSSTGRQIHMNHTTTKIEDIKYKLNHVNNQVALLKENKLKYELLISEVNIEKDLLMLERKLNLLDKVKIA